METSGAQPSLETLQEQLGYKFRQPERLLLALTHPSVCQEAGAPVEHNQRLEFLGDSVLELVLTAELYHRYPHFGEGPLTKARAQMVNRRSLAEYGRKLGLGQHLLLSRGEARHGGRERASILADAFEAVLGAIYLDGGLRAARATIFKLFSDQFSQFQQIPVIENPKGELQELLQVNSNVAPVYTVRSVSGPDHDRLFECSVSHLGVELGLGKGKSKKMAESEAALAALARLRQLKSPGE